MSDSDTNTATNTAAEPSVEEARAKVEEASREHNEAQATVVDQAVEAATAVADDAADAIQSGSEQVVEAQEEVAQEVQAQAEIVAEKLGLSDADIDGIAERIWQRIAPKVEGARADIRDVQEAVIESAPIQDEPTAPVIPEPAAIAEAETAVEAAPAPDAIRPRTTHWWYQWPPPFVRGRR